MQPLISVLAFSPLLSLLLLHSDSLNPIKQQQQQRRCDQSSNKSAPTGGACTYPGLKVNARIYCMLLVGECEQRTWHLLKLYSNACLYFHSKANSYIFERQRSHWKSIHLRLRPGVSSTSFQLKSPALSGEQRWGGSFAWENVRGRKGWWSWERSGTSPMRRGGQCSAETPNELLW